MQHLNNQHLTKHEIKTFDNRYRAKLINSLSGFKSANLIATYDDTGNTNLAIFSSVVHLGASPALVGFIMRPDSVERHTLTNIKQQKRYTINQVTADFWQLAHQTSARYAQHQSEFQQTGLTEQFIGEIKAPFVKESPIKYALSLKEVLPITANNTLMVIGEITDIICPAGLVKEDGYLDVESAGTVAISGLDSYHKTTRLGRISYAKPEQPLSFINLDGKPTS